MTTPVFVHLPGLFGDDWSWTTTVSPTVRGGSSLVPADRRSSIFACLLGKLPNKKNGKIVDKWSSRNLAIPKQSLILQFSLATAFCELHAN